MSLADEILGKWAPMLAGVELKSGSNGRFEVHVGGDQIFSKEKLDRFPRDGEIASILRPRLGQPPEWRASNP